MLTQTQLLKTAFWWFWSWIDVNSHNTLNLRRRELRGGFARLSCVSVARLCLILLFFIATSRQQLGGSIGYVHAIQACLRSVLGVDVEIVRSTLGRDKATQSAGLSSSSSMQSAQDANMRFVLLLLHLG